jgi:hypothetical protein
MFLGIQSLQKLRGNVEINLRAGMGQTWCSLLGLDTKRAEIMLMLPPLKFLMSFDKIKLTRNFSFR